MKGVIMNQGTLSAFVGPHTPQTASTTATKAAEPEYRWEPDLRDPHYVVRIHPNGYRE
jgi:hypothetical protein